MEAVGKYAFEATQKDELSFKKGDIIKILDMKTDENWYTAEREGKEGLVPNTYIEMRKHDWWFGRTPRAEAEKILKGEGTDGAFLVRDSEANPGDFSISVRFGDGVQHYKVLRDNEGRYFIWVRKFFSLNALIDYHRTVSISKTQHILLCDLNVHPQQQRQAAPEKWCEALYNFQPQNSDEIPLKPGNKIRIINQSDAYWWEGELETGERGMFPATYVKDLQ